MWKMKSVLSLIQFIDGYADMKIQVFHLFQWLLRNPQVILGDDFQVILEAVLGEPVE
jgi:hypothetical protein